MQILYPIAVSLAIGISFLGAATAQSYSDRDWNIKMKTSCGAPSKQSIQKVKIDGDRKIRLSLAPGDIGKCKTDNRSRHGAEYWERAEIYQNGFMKEGKTYQIEWTALFEEGYSSKDENFFQIHAWNGSCTAYPPLMVRFNHGYLRVMALQLLGPKAGQVWLSEENGRHSRVNRTQIPIKDLLGKETRFKVIAHFARNGWVSMYVNDRLIAEKGQMEMAACGKPYIKMGVYRPGPSLDNPNHRPKATSVVVVDDITIKELK